MKELDLKRKEKLVVSIEQQQEVQQSLEHLKTIHPHKNHTLWEINTITGCVKKAEFNLDSTYIFNLKWKPGDTIVTKGSLVVTPDCFYVSALSKETAVKKFLSGKDGSKFKSKGQIKFF
jgi:hypothetical protein